MTPARATSPMLVTLLVALLGSVTPGARAQSPLPAPDEVVEEEEVPSQAQEPVDVAPRYVVDAVEVRGNWKTADSVVLGRVEVRAGEFLDEEKLEVSRLRLLATGFFRDVTTRLSRGSARNHVIVVFAVVENIPIPMVDGLYLGFSSVTPLFGGISLVDNNFMGKGITVGFGGVVSPRQQGVKLRILEPSILRSSVGLRMRLLFNNGQEPIALGSNATAGGTVNYRRLGGSGGLMLTEGWVGRFAMDYRFELLWGDLRVVPGSSRPPRLLPGYSRLSTLTLSFERDTRDRLFVPTDGSVLRFSAEGSSALLLSNYEYGKFRASYEALAPLRKLWGRLREHALTFRMEAGYIQSGLQMGGESGAPFFEEFYVGDTSYFRYQRNSLPRTLGMNFSPFNEYGDLLVTFGSEYDFPIVTSGSGLLYRAYLYGAWDVTEVTRSRDVIQQRLRGRLLLDHFTPTFDLGLKLDTMLGTFILSGSYAVDLIL